ncbi:hypothetical protein H6G81_03000 [Scytonema hofmannii FACHB-248]|uniref:Uncharacterized protein n=1 Tax=Scytonema hofmannii FACHB-248 TaxID=1842502 RepID=A0ABR8GK24_9CYAN|nr:MULTISPECIES: hypothetical protein [Nostocales]MBD2603524.1 hypothetical protein [Scytonema hofmannii FACHB-248]
MPNLEIWRSPLHDINSKNNSAVRSQQLFGQSEKLIKRLGVFHPFFS